MAGIEEDDGTTPHMNPKVTMPAAIITLRDGVDLLNTDETAMVRGSTRPRAICPGKLIVEYRAVDKIDHYLEERSFYTT